MPANLHDLQCAQNCHILLVIFAIYARMVFEGLENFFLIFLMHYSSYAYISWKALSYNPMEGGVGGAYFWKD